MTTENSKHISLTIPGDKRLTSILVFHMSSDGSFGSDMSRDRSFENDMSSGTSLGLDPVSFDRLGGANDWPTLKWVMGAKRNPNL